MGETMTYSLTSDIRREFKSVLEQGDVVTESKIAEFQLGFYSMINSYLATRYSVPITGTSPVNQKDTIASAAAAGSGEVRQFTITVGSSTKTYSYTTDAAKTSLEISTALLAALNLDVNRMVDGEIVGNDLVIESKVLGLAYTVTAGSNVTATNTQVAVLGSTALRLLRKIESELVACKIAGILKTKVADKLQASGVRQDIKDESCGKQALAMLKDLQDGKAVLEDVSLASSGGGLESSAYAGTFKKDVRQW